MATKNYQKMLEEAKKAKEKFFNEHRKVLEEYKKLVREYSDTEQVITRVRQDKRREIMRYILEHDKEFTPFDLYRLCNCENCYHSPGSLGSAINYEWVFQQYRNKIDRKVRTIIRKYVEVDENGRIIPGSTLSRKTETFTYQAKREE